MLKRNGTLNSSTLMTVILLAAASIILIRTAWIGDEAAVTLRTVLNFIHGYGATFNIDERVQAYTHPSWFLIISVFSKIFGNVFYVTFLLSIGISLIGFWVLLTKLATTKVVGILGVGILLFSKAYLDYSTSGLENPLSHLILLFMALIALKLVDFNEKGGDFLKLSIFSLLTGLLCLTQASLVLLVLPLFALIFFEYRVQPALLVKSLAIGILPVIGWTLFATYYYGFPFSNTLYAMLNAGLTQDELIRQGLMYLLDSIENDPLTLSVIMIGIVCGFFSTSYSIAIAIGILLYLTGVIFIGGDYMSGRLLTAPLLMSVVIIVRLDLSARGLLFLGLIFGLLALNTIQSTILSGSDYSNKNIARNGIADERGFYFQEYGLLAAKKGAFQIGDWDVSERKYTLGVTNGYSGIQGGPGLHIVDVYAKGDPMLSRIPAKHNPEWRIGHLSRQLPTDYAESVMKGQNLLADRNSRILYNDIKLLTRESLSSPGRFAAIWNMNFKGPKDLDREAYRIGAIPLQSVTPVIPMSSVSNNFNEGAWDAPNNIQFHRAVEVMLSEPKSISNIELSMDNHNQYMLEILVGDTYHWLYKFGPNELLSIDKMVEYKFNRDKATPPVTRIRLTALTSNGDSALGYIHIQ